MVRQDIDLVRVIHAERVGHLLDDVQVDRAIRHSPRPSMRRLIGRSIVRIGSWVAAEPQLRPAAGSR